MAQRKELEELQEIARLATHEAFKAYEQFPPEWDKNLTLGSFFDGDDHIFELYVAAERPADAIVISSTKVNRKSKSVQVTISNLQKRSVT